jgi:hypothetical protein
VSWHTLKVAEVGLLVERGLVELERVDDVDLGLLGLVSTVLVAALGGSVGAGVEGLTTDGDLGTVGLVDHTIDSLEVVRVRDELVSADNILRDSGQLSARNCRCPPLVARSRIRYRNVPCKRA